MAFSASNSFSRVTRRATLSNVICGSFAIRSASVIGSPPGVSGLSGIASVTSVMSSGLNVNPLPSRRRASASVSTDIADS
jgi:hypothetical protein